MDPITQKKDFEGYRVYLSRLGFDVEGSQNLSEDFVRAAEYDLSGNGLFYETGLSDIALPEPLYFAGDTTAYHYHYALEGLPNGWQHAVAVTAFDQGNPDTQLESLESSFWRMMCGLLRAPLRTRA